MASPTVASRTESAVTTAGTTQTVNFTQTTNDLVVIFLATAASTALTGISDGFTNLTAVTNTFHILYKKLTGSEGGSMTVTTSSSKSCAVAYNIQGGEDPATQAPQISTVATATSTAPNATTVTPTGGSKDYLWITAFGQAGEEADDDTWTTGTPTNFTEPDPDHHRHRGRGRRQLPDGLGPVRLHRSEHGRRRLHHRPVTPVAGLHRGDPPARLGAEPDQPHRAEPRASWAVRTPP